MLTTVSHTGVSRQEAVNGPGLFTTPLRYKKLPHDRIRFLKNVLCGRKWRWWLYTMNKKWRRKRKKKSLRDSYQLLLSCQGFRHVEASATSQRARPPAARSRHSARDGLLGPAHIPSGSNRWRFISCSAYPRLQTQAVKITAACIKLNS